MKKVLLSEYLYSDNNEFVILNGMGGGGGESEWNEMFMNGRIIQG